jgi:hypothetical protein
MEDKEFWDNREVTLENFGIAPGPLDAYRGSGRHARATPKPRPAPAPKPAITKTPERKTIKVLDIAGNEVEIFIS